MARGLVLYGKHFVWVVRFPNRVMRWLDAQTPTKLLSTRVLL
jgi:hypothetical protein